MAGGGRSNIAPRRFGFAFYSCRRSGHFFSHFAHNCHTVARPLVADEAKRLFAAASASLSRDRRSVDRSSPPFHVRRADVASPPRGVRRRRRRAAQPAVAAGAHDVLDDPPVHLQRRARVPLQPRHAAARQRRPRRVDRRVRRVEFQHVLHQERLLVLAVHGAAAMLLRHL